MISDKKTPGCKSLHSKVLSPTGVISRDLGGIGLGIVAALDYRNRIPVTQSRTVGDRVKKHKAGSLDLEEDGHMINSDKPNKPVAKVYHGGRRTEIRKKGCIFDISPARFGDDDMRVPEGASFLNSCHLCSKRLDGKDIYMYRGEKAFCSPECRSRQIGMDERPEKHCSSQASSSGHSRVMATGIFAI